MPKSDYWIQHSLAVRGGIDPFVDHLVRREGDRAVISYGLSSYGYDIRLSPKDFRVFRHIPGTVIDPKQFNPANLESVELHHDAQGEFFILPGHSYGLGVALERIEVPDNITVICIGKSTYARCGIIANLTPAEACMSSDTEILAKTGWKLLSDVIIGEEVLTLNPDTQTAEYQPVLDTQSYYVNGTLNHFQTRYVDQLVTDQHRMWVGKRKQRVLSAATTGWSTKQKGVLRSTQSFWDWDFVRAKDLMGQWNCYLSRAVNWQGIQRKVDDAFAIDKYTMTWGDWCTFLGCWMGDGSTYATPNGNYVIKLAVVTKTAKRNYFRALLQRMGVNYCETAWGFSFQNKTVHKYLAPLKGAKNKHLPLAIKQLCPELLNCVINGMMHSDGCLSTMTYTTTSKRLIDDFQEIAIKAGWNATVWNRKTMLSGQMFHSYAGRITPANKTPNKVLPDQMTKVPYSGMVYDVTVPNHVFLSRRDGRASWTGNSWNGHLTLEFSNSSSADCRLYANEGVAQLLFFAGDPCQTTYQDRAGKYQNQPHQVTIARA